ncbi:MAG: hypothetical protein MRQ09_06720 [Candidatus Midichloria sp.]|nr:hypothetical protein [Candidatus Midichloria sp.]
MSYCIHAPALLSSRDKLIKLKVIDYAYLSKNKQIIDTITDRRMGEEIEVQLAKLARDFGM